MYETTEAQFLGSESTELHVREAMAQWQRVGFQTRRLGVRIPLASFLFPLQAILFLFLEEEEEKLNKKKDAETGNRTQAAAATTRSPATRLFRQACGGSGYRSRFSTLRRLYATMYNNPPCVHRDSNPNLNLGRVKYYPCTMDARRDCFA